ncbi:MAG: rhomboid family intramembrane serine protease [Clostridiaceae bacterium]|nr:rhomboid family intramembrane serine protease [Clostridiaceae bacterium]
MNWLNKLERKYRKFAIPGFINYLVGLTGIVYALDYITRSNLIEKISFDRDLILKGEVWRLVSYIFVPPSTTILWIFFALYFLYMIGTGLEQEWGSFKFNFYYFTGVIGTTLGAFIAGGNGTTIYLSMSLLLAFAYIYPDFEILVFLILPVKMKYLGYLTWITYGYALIKNPFNIKIAIIVSIINFFIFFSGDIIKNLKNKKSVTKNRQKFKVQKYAPESIHKCTICGRTEKDDSKLEFRYCSKCEGRHAYCSEHLFSHTHIK